MDERTGAAQCSLENSDRDIGVTVRRIWENLQIDGDKPRFRDIARYLEEHHPMTDIGKDESVGIQSESSDIDLEPWERQTEGMYRALNLVERKAQGEVDHGFDGDDVLALHKAVLNDPFNPHLSGSLRNVGVKISVRVRGQIREANFYPVHPKDLPQLYAGFSEELNSRTRDLNGESQVADVIETAAWAHQRLIELHPFRDGNGRTARLLVDLIFKRAGLPYITDWGARNDEYKDVVDRSFRNEDANLFKKLLAEKLLKSVSELERDGLAGEVSGLKDGISSYLGKF